MSSPTELFATRKHIQPMKRAPSDPLKLYSAHAPEAECFAKSKVHKQYEFGVKLGIVSTSKESFVLAEKSLLGNPYDRHTMKACFERATRVTGVASQEAYAGRGYKRHNLRRIIRKRRLLRLLWNHGA